MSDEEKVVNETQTEEITTNEVVEAAAEETTVDEAVSEVEESHL